MAWSAWVSSESVTDRAAMLVAGSCIVRLAWMATRKRIRVRRPRALAFLRLVALVGTTVTSFPTVGSAAGSARHPAPVAVDRARSVRRLPEGPAPAPPWSASDGSSPPRPFERAEEEPSPPAGPETRSEVPRVHANTHEVRSGDTLWDIAAHALGSDDAGRIARYWPAIYRVNRATIGDDPNLVRPGQLLFLPPEARP